MFKFLKDKLKSALSRFSRGVEASEMPHISECAQEHASAVLDKKAVEAVEARKEQSTRRQSLLCPENHGVVSKDSFVSQKPSVSVIKEEKAEHIEKPKEIREKISIKEEKQKEAPKEEPKKHEEQMAATAAPAQKPEKKGFFAKLTEQVTTKALSESKFEELFWELEVVLMENNVAVEVIEKIKNDLKKELVNERFGFGKVKEIIEKTLDSSIKELFDVDKIDLLKRIKQKKPYVICFIGVNGSGKTTTIAKFVRMLQKNKLSCIIAAADTFRAASQEQLQLHADKLDVKLIKHNYNADPAAVAYDAIEHAKAAKKDVVLIDTAGRSHSNTNLMDELKKVVKVAKPDLKVFVGDSLTGNDAVEQAKSFDEAVGIDAIVLSKVDVDEKGGAAISVSYVTKKPIIYIGVGQEYDDLNDFNADAIIKSLGFEA